MKITKKLIAILLTLAVIATFSVCALATGSDTAINVASDASYTENNDGSYKLVIAKGNTNQTTSALVEKIDLRTQGIKFKFIENGSSKYDRGMFTFASSATKITAPSVNNYGVSFALVKQDETNYRLALYVDGIETVAWAAINITQADVHEYGIAKDGDNYWLTIDGVNKVDLTSKSADTLIKEMYASGEAYAHFNVLDSDVDCTFDGIEVTGEPSSSNTSSDSTSSDSTSSDSTSSSEPANPAADWDLNANMSVAGNTDGYTLTKNETAAADTNTSVLKKPIDLKTQTFSFAFASPNSTYGQGIFVLTNAANKLTGNTDTSNGAAAFLLSSNSDTWRLDAYNGTVATTWLTTFTKADVHTFGIAKVGNNFWLTIDGVNKVDLTTKVPNTAAAIEALYDAGVAYLNLGVAGTGKACTFSGIKVIDEPSSDNTSSDNTSSDNTSSDNTSSDNTSSDNTSSDNTSSDNTSSDNTSSDNTSSDNTSSEAPTPESLWDKSDEITVSGDADSGYKLEGITKYSSALLKTPININTQEIEFSSNYCNQTRLVFRLQGDTTRGTDAFLTTQILDERSIYDLHLHHQWDVFYLWRTESSMSAVMYKNPTTGKDLALTKETKHRFGFNKVDDEWWLSVDGKNVVNMSLVDPKATARIAKLAESGKAYLSFTAWSPDATKYPVSYNINNLKVVEKSASGSSGGSTSGPAADDAFTVDDKGSWKMGGDAATGYSLKYTGSVSLANRSVAVLTTPIDIKTQSLQFKVNNEAGSTCRPFNFALVNTDSPLSMLINGESEINNKKDGVTYNTIQVAGSMNMVFDSMNGNAKGTLPIPALKVGQVNTLGFKKVNNDWWLVINGEEVISLTENDDPCVHTNLDKLADSGKAYFQFASYLIGLDVSNLKIVNNSDIGNSGDDSDDSFDNSNGDWEFDWNGGSAESDTVVKTGDSSAPVAVAIVMAVAVFALAALVVIKKKTSQN